MKTKFVALLTLIVTACSSMPKVSVETQKTVPKEVFQKVLPALFEVVVPRPDEIGLTYERPLPVERLPYQMRTDKYASVGTAFAIGNNQFVSAAHVFPLFMQSYLHDYSLRDRNGKVYALDKVLRYSSYRDLIVFTLKQPPSDVAPLVVANNVEVGDSVFVVGNAQGEGISLRAGQVSSFTPEEVDNAWKFIRFSAAASPGNSGGPLLDEKGEVVGVVLRKNGSENLNFAIPIQQLERLKTSTAEFMVRNQTYQRDQVSETKTWNFSTPLPQKIDELAKVSESNYRTYNQTTLMALYDKKDQRFFPANKHFVDFLRRQYVRSGISILAPPSAGDEWTSHLLKTNSIDLAPNEAIQWTTGKTVTYFYIHAPKGMDTFAFATDPKLVLDRALKALGVERPYAGEKIKITSFGHPESKNVWRDELGRPWLESTWDAQPLNTVFFLNCSPTPRGAFCRLDSLAKQLTTLGAEIVIHQQLNTVLWSLGGSFAEWKKYLASSSELLPDAYKKAQLSLEGHKLSIALGNKVLHYQNGDLNDKSEISVRVRYSLDAQPQMEIASLSVKPRKEHELHFAKYWIWEPTENAPEKTTQYWHNLRDKAQVFDGEVHQDGKWKEVYLVGPKSVARGVNYYEVIDCSLNLDESTDQLKELCHKFFDSNFSTVHAG
jgi:serine protease Do